MTVESFRIETESEADDYLKDLLAKPEFRSMDEVAMRAHKLIPDQRIVEYFTNRAREILQTYS